MNEPGFDLTLAYTRPPGSKLNRSPTNPSSSDSPYRSPDSSHPDGKSRDPEKQCPLHKKPHPLLKCRAFREKSLEDCKAFLKENHICFRCCSSASHLAKDCKVSVTCRVQNQSPNTALYPSPAPWTDEPADNANRQGGEQKNIVSNTPVVTSQCTEVCKYSAGGRSFSKICLVRVYPKGQRNKAIKMYVI